MAGRGALDAWAGSRGLDAGRDLARTMAARSIITTRSIILANGNKAPAASGGWRINDAAGGVLSLDATMRRRPGIDTTKVDATGTSGAVFKSVRIKTEVLTTHNGVIGIWVFIPVLSAGGLSLTLRWSSDVPAADPPTVTAANYYAVDFVNDNQQRGKWAFLSISGPAGKVFGPGLSANGVAASTTGAPAAGQIRQVELIESWNAATPSAERVFWIDCVEANGKCKPMICLGWDGFGDSQVSIDAKLAKLDQYAIPAYIAGDGDAAAANASKLTQFADRGFDVISQGIAHTDYAANPSALAADYDSARAILAGLGFTRSLDLFAYPFNNRSAATDAILAAKGVRLARTTLGNWRTAYNITGTTDPLATAAANTDNRTAAQMQLIIDEAVASGSHLFLYGHSVTSAAASSTNQNLTEFNTMMDYIGSLFRAGTIDVVTASEWADRMGV